MVGVFILCATVGLLRYSDWNIADYSFKSVILLVVGILSFLSASYLVYSFQRHNNNITIPLSRKRLDIPKWYVLFSLLLGVVFLYVMYKQMQYSILVAGYKNGSITQLISKFHLLSLYAPEKYRISAYVRYAMLIVIANSMVYLYVFIHNSCFRVFKKRDLFYVVNVFPWPIYAILASSRYELMVMMAMTLYFLYFLGGMHYGKPVKVRRKIFKIGTKMLLAFLTLFIMLTVFLGRSKSFSDINILNYITIYISAGIRNFDLYINNPQLAEHVISETFPTINSIMYKCFGIGEYHSLPLEFRNINGLNTGNIFTCFRRYYADFGVLGVFIIPFFLGLIITGLYYSSKKSCKNNKIGFELILFAYLARCIFFMPIEDYFFIFDVSPRGIFKITILYILYCLFIKKRVMLKTDSNA